jgi:hypothetical protein
MIGSAECGAQPRFTASRLNDFEEPVTMNVEEMIKKDQEFHN